MAVDPRGKRGTRLAAEEGQSWMSVRMPGNTSPRSNVARTSAMETLSLLSVRLVEEPCVGLWSSVGLSPC